MESNWRWKAVGAVHERLDGLTQRPLTVTLQKQLSGGRQGKGQAA